MPTFNFADSFHGDYKSLGIEEREKVKAVITMFREDLAAIEEGTLNDFRPRLRVKPLQAQSGIFEMTWEGNDGRATFEFGAEQVAGKRHVTWRRIGSHAILRNP